MVAAIGENMTVRRTSALSVKDGVVASYVHNQIAPGMGKIGVIVALESTGSKASLAEFGRMLAMHVAATNPVALTLDQVPADVLARESAILEEKNAGKPANVMEKIVASGLKTFAKENCLLEQSYVHDGAKTVAQAIAEAAKAAGGDVKLTGFVRMQLGEGIEKKEDDFAAEVAKMSGN
jgi:elongation factor Ts